jgi:DUF1009 family protein
MNPSLPESLLIIAGWGVYPQLLALGARRAGVRHIEAIGFRGTSYKDLMPLLDKFESMPMGSLSRFMKTVDANTCEAATLVGQIHPLTLFRAKFDEAARGELKRLSLRNAHTIYGRIADMVADAGKRVLPASLFMDAHLPRAGCLTRRAPTAEEAEDIAYGMRTALSICDLDIGQTLVVKRGSVLAVEAFEGTDAAIRRGARLGGDGAVVVKVAKNGHDMRFDIPVMGMRSLRVLRRCRVRTLGIQAGRVLLLEQDRFLAEADRMGLAISAVETGLPVAPTFVEAAAGEAG